MYIRYNVTTEEYTQHQSLYKTMDGNLAKLESGIMQLEVVANPPTYNPETEYVRFSGYDIDITAPNDFLNGTATEQWEVIAKTEQDFINEAIAEADSIDKQIDLSTAKRLLYELSDFDNDQDRLDNIALHPYWRPGLVITSNLYYRYKDKLYKVNPAHVPHTSQIGWEPDNTPAIFTEISEEEYPEWVRPTGAHDAYMTGDKITFENKRYISLADNNIYSPTEYPQWWEEL